MGKWLLFLSIVSLSFGIAEAAELESISSTYASRDYSRCLKLVEALPATKRSPKDEYYQALCYQALRRYEDASAIFLRLSKQSKDGRIKELSSKAWLGLRKVPGSVSVNSLRKASRVKLADSPKKTAYQTDEQWKIQSPGFGGQGENRDGMPEDWTYKKTSSGCGRHR